MKRILMVTSFYPPYHVGGACTHVYYLANELAKKGHEVHVLFSIDSYYLKRKNKPKTSNYKNHKNVHLHPIETPVGKLTPVSSYILGIIPFNKQILKLFEQKWDLIHYHNISLFGPRIFNYGESRKIYTAHDHWLVCPLNDFFDSGQKCNKFPWDLTCSLCLVKNKRPVQFWRYSNLLKDSLKNIDFIISPSRYLRHFMEVNSIDTPIKVLPNFIHPFEEAKDIKQKNYFFYAGQLEDIKGIRVLLNAFKNSDKKLIIAGEGSLKKYVKNFVRTNTNIVYVGWLDIEEMYSYYGNSLAFILPSLCPENSPLTILEAMSTGTPSIGSDIGGIPEIIGKIDENLIFNCGDIKDLREKVNNFDKEEYKEEEIKKVFNKHFSAENYVENYLKNLE